MSGSTCDGLLIVEEQLLLYKTKKTHVLEKEYLMGWLGLELGLGLARACRATKNTSTTSRGRCFFVRLSHDGKEAAARGSKMQKKFEAHFVCMCHP